MNLIVTRWITATVGATLVAGCATGTSTTGSSTAAPSFGPSVSLTGSLSVMGFGNTDEIASTRLDAAKAALTGVNVSLIEGDLDIQQFLSLGRLRRPPSLVYASREPDRHLRLPRRRSCRSPTASSGEGIDTTDFRRVGARPGHLRRRRSTAIPEFNSVQITHGQRRPARAKPATRIADVNGSDWDAGSRREQDTHEVADGGNLSVIGFDSKLPEFLPLWAKANGADLLSADGRTAQLDDPTVVEALDLGGVDLRRSGRLRPP